ncbi:MAG: hypothetical protein GY868_07625, partial [Deltaproteobacteria bacterium]|nr:hypothetical protein [Deltaproteobacteria bacterium]
MDIFEYIVEAKKRNEPLVLATVIESLGSAPRGAGARMIIRQDGTTLGTVGGGAIEKIAADEALKMMGAAAPKTIKHTLKDLGMACGGGMTIFLEPLNPAPQLFVFGGGHIGAVLSQIAKLMDFSVTVIDNRPEFADAAKLPWVDAALSAEYDEAIEQLAFSTNTYVVILTHKHLYDFAVLENCLKQPHCYVGMIGSKKKVATCLEKLRHQGVTEE